MKKILMAAALVLSLSVTTGVEAYSCAQQVNGISELSERDKQSMIVQCEQNKLKEVEAPKIGGTTIAEMDKWSDISLKFAKAIGVAAKEFGVAVNEFLDTDAGKLTAAFIAWQVLGDDLTFMLYTSFAVVFMFYTMAKLRKSIRLNGYEEVDRVVMGKVVGKRSVPLFLPWRSLDDGSCILIVISHIVEVILLLVIIVHA